MLYNYFSQELELQQKTSEVAQAVPVATPVRSEAPVPGTAGPDDETQAADIAAQFVTPAKTDTGASLNMIQLGTLKLSSTINLFMIWWCGFLRRWPRLDLHAPVLLVHLQSLALMQLRTQRKQWAAVVIEPSITWG